MQKLANLLSLSSKFVLFFFANSKPPWAHHLLAISILQRSQVPCDVPKMACLLYFIIHTSAGRYQKLSKSIYCLGLIHNMNKYCLLPNSANFS